MTGIQRGTTQWNGKKLINAQANNNSSSEQRDKHGLAPGRSQKAADTAQVPLLCFQKPFFQVVK